jgi:hypothetical protein
MDSVAWRFVACLVVAMLGAGAWNARRNGDWARRTLSAVEMCVVLTVLLMLVGSVTLAVAVATGLATGADVF